MTIITNYEAFYAGRKSPFEHSWFDEAKGKRKDAIDQPQMIALVSVGAHQA